MAGSDMPDTLTPEQAAKLGFIPKGGGNPDMPDTLTPDQAKKLGLASSDTLPDAEPPPGIFERIGTGFGRMAHTVGAGAGALFGHSPLIAAISAPEGESLKAAGGAFVDSMKDVTDPARRKQVLRGLDNMTSLGYGQRIAARVGNALGDTETGHTLNETRRFSLDPRAGNISGPSQVEAAERAAAPGYEEAGTLLGLPLGASGAAGKTGGKLVQMATAAAKPASIAGRAALGAGRSVAGYELTAPALSGLSADSEGRRLEAARDAATDPAGLLLAGTIGAGSGAAQRITETAPARKLANNKADITTGEQNAGIKLTRRVSERAGEDNERLAKLFERDPELDKAITVKAATSPKKALQATAKSLDRVDNRLDEIYDEMSKADRLVTPQDIANGFDKILGERLKAGDLPAVNILRAERARFLNEYGKFGKLSADTMRGLKATAGKGAFEGQPIPGNVKRDIWAAYADAIETQAKGTKGVDLKELRDLNSDRSMLLPIRDALAERATSAAHGRFSIKELIHSPAASIGSAGLGAMIGHQTGHSVLGTVAGLAAPTAANVVRQAGRTLDYNLAQRGGVAAERAGAVGGRVGSMDYAARVSQGMKDGMSLKEAVDAAGEEE